MCFGFTCKGGSAGCGRRSDVSAGLEWVLTDCAAHPEARCVVQRSLTGGFLTEDAALLNANVLVVASAGNSQRNRCRRLYDPLTTFDKILVGSTSRSDGASSFSNYGPCVHMQVFETPHPRPWRPPCQSASGRRASPAAALSPAAHVRRPQARASWERGLAQATQRPTPSVAPAWRRRMSRESPLSFSRRTRPSRWRESRRCSSPPRRWDPSCFLQTQFKGKRPTAS